MDLKKRVALGNNGLLDNFDDSIEGEFPLIPNIPGAISCFDYFNAGIKDPGTYTIDPDGTGDNNQPFDVVCKEDGLKEKDPHRKVVKW